MIASPIPRREAWALATILSAGAPLTMLAGFTSPLGKEAAEAIAKSNGTGPDAAFNAWLGTLDPEVADALKTAIMREDPTVEPAEGATARYTRIEAREAFDPQPDIDWIVDQLFQPAGVYIFFGTPGSKKTWSLMDCAVCVAKGEPWIGYVVSRGRVLIVDEESGPRRYKRRLQQLLLGHDAPLELPITCISMADFNLLRNPGDAEELGRLVAEIKPRLVILDALADFMAGGDENSVRDTQPVFRALRRLADKFDCAIVVIHHDNKVGGYRGSSAIAGAVDGMISVASPVDGSVIDFDFPKPRDVEPFRFAAELTFDNIRGSAKLVPAEVAARQPSGFTGAKGHVMKLLKDGGPLPLAEMAAQAEPFTDAAVRSAVRRLYLDGEIAKVETPAGVAYAIPSQGGDTP